MGNTDAFDLSGRVALITGAAGGIGRAVARALGARGAALALVDVREPELAEAAAQLTEAGVKVWSDVVDITDEAAVDGLLDRATAALGTVNVLVNNAAVGTHTVPEELELAVGTGSSRSTSPADS